MAQLEGVWAIVISGPARFIGRAKDYDKSSQLIVAMERRETVRLDPVFDYHLQLQLGPNGAAKIPVITPLDMIEEPCPLYVVPNALILFEDMQAEDRKRYESFVDSAMQDIRTRKLKRAGIELPERPRVA